MVSGVGLVWIGLALDDKHGRLRYYCAFVSISLL